MSFPWPQIPLWAISAEAQTGPFGSQLHSDEYVKEGIPVVNPSNIVNGRIVPNWNISVDGATAQRLARHRLEPGDLLFSRRGELGRAAVVQNAEAGWLCGTGSLRVRLREGALDSRFAAYALQSAATQSYFERTAVGTTMENLNTDIVTRLPLPLPPVPDQIEIADLLDAETARVDALIAKKARIVELTEDRRRAEAALCYDQAAREYGSVPMRHLLHRIEQGWSPDCENREADPYEWGVLKAGCVNHGVFRAEQNKALPADVAPREKYAIREGDLLLCRASGSRHLIGSVAIVRNLNRRLLLCDKIYRLHVNSQLALPEFIESAMSVPQLRERILLGISGASGLASNIPAEVILELPVPRIPVEAQRRFAKRIFRANRSTRMIGETIERQLVLLRERRRAVITATVADKRDDRHPGL